MFLTIFTFLDSENYKKRYFGAFQGVENWKSVTFWRVLFIRGQSVVDVILMRNNWKLRNCSCFFVVLERRYDQNEKGQPFRCADPPPVQHQGLSSVGSTELAVALGLDVFW